jgi:hypothetical protein
MRSFDTRQGERAITLLSWKASGWRLDPNTVGTRDKKLNPLSCERGLV